MYIGIGTIVVIVIIVLVVLMLRRRLPAGNRPARTQPGRWSPRTSAPGLTHHRRDPEIPARDR